MEKIAIIKINAQSIKLSLIDVSPNGYYNLFDEITEYVKIGQSVEQFNLIKPNIISESLTVLKLFRSLCDANNVSKTVAMCECFIKPAKNQKSFFDEIYNNTGFIFNILSSEEEVKYVYKGITNLIDVSKAMAVYVGPNETHIMHYNRRTVIGSINIGLGYINLAEKYAEETDPAKKCKLMEEEVMSALKDNPFLDSIEPELTFVGAGLIFETVGKLARKITKYPLDIENNYCLTQEACDAVYDVVKDLDLDKTKKLKGITEDRADSLASGVSIVKALMTMCKTPCMYVAANAFEEGIITQSLPAESVEFMSTDMLTNSLETIRTFYDRGVSNTANVYNLAILLYKQLKVIHKLPRTYVKSLRIAASMYDCGTRINFNNHANKSLEIIINSKLNGASQKDILLAGFICKAQNLENLTLAEWLKYKDVLTEEDLDAVRKLGIVLKLAVSMDKSRMGLITDVTCDILGDSIIMKTIVKSDAHFDIIQAQKVGPDFKKIFKKVLQVI